MACQRMFSYVELEQTGVLPEMHRFALALIVAAILVGLTVVLLRNAARSFERGGGTAALTSGGAMQKAAFFVLLLLIMYVSISGGA